MGLPGISISPFHHHLSSQRCLGTGRSRRSQLTERFERFEACGSLRRIEHSVDVGSESLWDLDGYHLSTKVMFNHSNDLVCGNCEAGGYTTMDDCCFSIVFL